MYKYCTCASSLRRYVSSFLVASSVQNSTFTRLEKACINEEKVEKSFELYFFAHRAVARKSSQGQREAAKTRGNNMASSCKCKVAATRSPYRCLVPSGYVLLEKTRRR